MQDRQGLAQIEIEDLEKKLAKSGSQGRYAIMHVAERKLNYTRRIKKIICGPCNALHKGAKSFQREYFPLFDTETKF